MLSTEDILAATAHELRLPLSHIKGFVTSLRRTDVEWDAATQKEFITEIDLETDRLAEVVETLCTQRSVGWLPTHRTAATNQLRPSASPTPRPSSRAHYTGCAVWLKGGRFG